MSATLSDVSDQPRFEGHSASFVIIAIWLLCLSAGWWFSRRVLFREVRLSSSSTIRLAAGLFSISLSLSGLLILLLGLQLVPIVDGHTRKEAWSTCLYGILIMVYILLPISFILIILPRSPNGLAGRSHRWLQVTCCALLAAYMVIWTIRQKLGVPWNEIRNLPNRFVGNGFLLSTTGSAGVVIVAVISGYGAVKFPYSNISRLMSPVTARDLWEQQQRLVHTLQLIGERKRAVLVQRAKRTTENHAGGQGKGHFSTILGWIFGNSSEGASEKELMNEIAALESMSTEMFGDLEQLTEERERVVYSTTCMGRFKNIWGWIMSAVCGYKIVTSTLNFINGKVAERSLIERLLRVAITYTPLQIDIQYWLHLLTVIFLGYLALTNTRNCISQLLSLFRVLQPHADMNSARKSNAAIAIVMAEVMLLYFCACTLMMRGALPLNSRARIELERFFGDRVDFAALQLRFDCTFAIAACISVALLTLQWFYRRATTKSVLKTA